MALYNVCTYDMHPYSITLNECKKRYVGVSFDKKVLLLQCGMREGGNAPAYCTVLGHLLRVSDSFLGCLLFEFSFFLGGSVHSR